MQGKSFAFLAHQHKGTAFLEALLAAGAKRVRRVDKADFVFADFCYSGVFAGTGQKLRPEIKAAKEQGKPVFLYPHSYAAYLPYDLEDNPVAVDAFFVPSVGFAEILRRINYPAPAEVVGWSYCDVRDFVPFTGTKPRVLFAPLHPVGNSLPQVERDINAHVFKLLYMLLKAGDIASLTVRHYGALETNGLQRKPRVIYTKSELDGATDDMERNDVIVSSGTFAYMSVALGKPTVFMGQDIMPHNSPRAGGELRFVKSWNGYKFRGYREYVMNMRGVEIGHGADYLYHQMIIAARNQDVLWRDLHIGAPFDAKLFIERVKAYL